MRTIILFLLLSLFPSNAQAEKTTVGILKDGKIILQQEDTARVLDYDAPDDKYSPPYDLKKWNVIEQIDPVNEALAVYKKKGRAPYSKKVYIIDKTDGSKKIVVEYEARDKNEKVFFSPDEGYVYYRDLSGSGGNVVMGLDLSTNKEFFVAKANDFFLSTCPDKTTYVVVRDEDAGTQNTYAIYSESGANVKTVVYDGDTSGIGQVICY